MHGAPGPHLPVLPERAASFKAETRFPGMPSETLSSGEEARRSAAKSHPATSHSTTKYPPPISPPLSVNVSAKRLTQGFVIIT